MKTQYITVVANVPKIVPLDTNQEAFQVTLRTNTASVDVTVDNIFDPKITPTWYPATVSALVAGAYVLDAVVSAVRFSSPDGEIIKLDQTGSFRDGPPGGSSPPAPPADMLLSRFNPINASIGNFQIDSNTIALWGGNYGQHLLFKLTATGGAADVKAAIDGQTFEFNIDDPVTPRIGCVTMTALGALSTNQVPVPGLTASAQYIGVAP